MLKKYLPKIIITSLIVLLPIVFGLIVWNKLPEQVPTHFGPSGDADGWSSKAFAVFMLPLFMLVMHIFCAITTLIDPKRRNVDGKPFGMALWLCPAISLASNGAMYSMALGYKFNTSVVVMLLFGVLLIILGNYLPKCGQNYTIGIKTPWALDDPKNWTATHRIGGKVYMTAGLILIPLSFLCAMSEYAFWIVFVVMMVTVSIPALYSYLYYCKHGKTEE